MSDYPGYNVPTDNNNQRATGYGNIRDDSHHNSGHATQPMALGPDVPMGDSFPNGFIDPTPPRNAAYYHDHRPYNSNGEEIGFDGNLCILHRGIIRKKTAPLRRGSKVVVYSPPMTTFLTR